MAEKERIRVELAFTGGPIIAANLEVAAADELERAVAAGDGVVRAETEDGQIIVVAAKVAYLKRFRRESTIGFGA